MRDFPQFGGIRPGMDLRARATALAAEIRAHLRQPQPDRFDAPAAARRLGFRIVVEDLPPGYAGRIELGRGDPLITLRRGDPQRRRRFTLAHELAHLGFRAADASLPWERQRCSSGGDVRRREEWLCDQIAADLLVPPEALGREAARHRPSAAALAELADHYLVSWPVLLKQLQRAQAWSVGEVVWRLTPSGELGCELRRRFTLRADLREENAVRHALFRMRGALHGVRRRLRGGNDRLIPTRAASSCYTVWNIEGADVVVWHGPKTTAFVLA